MRQICSECFPHVKEVGTLMTTLVLHTRKLRHREAKQVAPVAWLVDGLARI